MFHERLLQELDLCLSEIRAIRVELNKLENASSLQEERRLSGVNRLADLTASLAELEQNIEPMLREFQERGTLGRARKAKMILVGAILGSIPAWLAIAMAILEYLKK